MDSTTYAEELQDHSAFPRLCPDVFNAVNYTFCHWAKTVVGLDPNSELYVAIGVTCKRWGCPYCAIRKIRRLAWMSRNAEPTRLLTLTVAGPDKEQRPGRYKTGEEAWQATSAAFPELIRWIRKSIGEVEYLRVLELQENGMPHFHCMLRSPFIPHAPLHAEWKRLIGKPDHEEHDNPVRKQWAGVNLKRIDSTFRTFRYLVKYLTKLHKIPWTDRHVSYSRGFFREEDKEEVAYAKLDNIVKYDSHPWVFMRERFAWETVAILGEGKWGLPTEPPDPYLTVDPQQLGLPAPKTDEPPLPIKQRLVPGLEDATAVDENDGLRADGKRRRSKPRSSPQLPTPAAPAAECPF